MIWLLVAMAMMLPGELRELSPRNIERLEAAQIGDTVTLIIPEGDGCNTCDESVVKTGDGTFRSLGVIGCTLLNCRRDPPVERWK